MTLFVFKYAVLSRFINNMIDGTTAFTNYILDDTSQPMYE